MRRINAVLLILTVTCTFWISIGCAQAPVADEPSSWFSATQVSEGVWAINDNNSDNIYLVEGNDKALLIDTGLGVAKLSDFVRTLTTKPLLVVNTHGHPDHAGGNFQFKEVHAHPADFGAIKQVGNKESRSQAASNMATGTPGPDMVSIEEAVNAPEAELLPIKAGYVFDLGGRKLEVIETPGHTPGEVVLLDASNKAVFSGDNNNVLVWLFLPTSMPLETYLESLKNLQARSSEFDTIYPGHGGPLPNTFISEQIACVEGILDGSIKSEPQKFFAGEAMVAKYKSASVAYDPENLRANK